MPVLLASDLLERRRRKRAERGVQPPLEQLLSPEAWRPRRRTGAEHAKALGYVQQAVDDTRRFLAALAHETPAQVDAVKKELSELLTLGGRTIDTAWDLYTALKQQLVRMGDPQYLLMLLEHEQIRNGAKGKWHSWADHFEEGTLQALHDRFSASPGDTKIRDEVVYRLTFLYKERAAAGRERRARAAQKCRFMTVLAPVLLLLLAGLGVSTELVDRGGGVWRQIVMAATAGALGSVLAGTLKLRDRLVELDDLRAFGATIRVQPLVGATMGVIVLVALQSDIVRIGGEQVSAWPGRAALAFLAGFSEPFFLRVVDRLAVLPDRAAQTQGAAVPADAPAAATANQPHAS